MNHNHFSIRPWHPGIKMSPIEWDRCEKNRIVALHRKNHHCFPSTLSSGIPLAPPAVQNTQSMHVIWFLENVVNDVC